MDPVSGPARTRHAWGIPFRALGAGGGIAVGGAVAFRVVLSERGPPLWALCAICLAATLGVGLVWLAVRVALAGPAYLDAVEPRLRAGGWEPVRRVGLMRQFARGRQRLFVVANPRFGEAVWRLWVDDREVATLSTRLHEFPEGLGDA
ncbi:hypothetical protein STVA_12450 [Allostella vacuolata]|nr:hypothetical protein STVA_12450 [Stella vacuolata]